MIDTDKSEIPWHSWREMKNHTPWGPEWSMLGAQNWLDVPFKRRERYQEGLVGCVINFHMTDTRWDDNEAMVAEANQELIMNAPRLYAEVERLREGIQNALYLFQEAGNPKMSDKKRLDTICDALLEVIE